MKRADEHRILQTFRCRKSTELNVKKGFPLTMGIFPVQPYLVNGSPFPICLLRLRTFSSL